MLIGPGGVGKGTVAARLTERDRRLWLSRSWTTRARRPGEPEEAYVFTDRDHFMARARTGGFLEWAEFLGNLYGTPVPDPPAGQDVLLEIDLQGARQVADLRPDAVVILLLPPSAEAQRERLEARGDSPEHVRQRIDKGRQEIEEGRKLARYQVVNDQLDRAVAQIAGIIDRTRREDL